MCTAITLNGNNNYFGRNLDLDFSYGEQVIITPAEYEFKFRKEKAIKNHKSLIGVGIVANDYPLYFDAINEDGLGMAGLNFPWTNKLEIPFSDIDEIELYKSEE